MEVNPHRRVLAISRLGEGVRSLDRDLVAFVLNAIEFHAHRGTIWSAELQLRRLPFATRTVFLRDGAREDGGHVAVRRLMHCIASHRQNGTIEELNELLASTAKRQILQHQRSLNHLFIRESGHQLIRFGRGQQSRAAARHGGHGEATSVRTPLGLPLSSSTGGLGLFSLLVLLLFISVCFFLLDLVLLLFLFGARPLSLRLTFHTFTFDLALCLTFHFAFGPLSLCGKGIEVFPFRSFHLHFVLHIFFTSHLFLLDISFLLDTLSLDALTFHCVDFDVLLLLLLLLFHLRI
mmetsp:Transcript_12038/g.26591  ORF Transcript_12038/g.26591 Transcript_12038/m.26591 type:complete len:292 (+) Transcript_12038:851-1726(+)